MNGKRCILLGRSSFVSKKGTNCFTLQVGVPYSDSKRGEGFASKSFFVSESEYKDFSGLTYPTSLLLDIRFVNGGDALLGYDLKSEDASALWSMDE